VSDLLLRLINSPSLRLGQEGVELGFVHALPPWAWALVMLASAFFGWLGYRRLEGPAPARAALGALRGGLILLIAVLICQPRLIKTSETVEKDWVLVLIDRSASLSVADAPPLGPGSADAGPEARERQLRSLLESAAPTFRQLGAERVLVWLGFDASAYELPVSKETGTPSLAEPTGRRTDLNRAIEQALRKSAARPLAGVVVFSDGRAVEPPARSLLRRLEAEKVPVFTVALGSPTSLPDLSVRRVEAPRTGFVKDSVPVQVELERSGPPAAQGESAIVELIDEATGAVMDARPLVWDQAGPAGPAGTAGTADSGEQIKRLTLRSTAAIAGSGKWNVRIRPAPGSPADMVASNNASDFSIDLLDRPLRVAYFDGYPRWEYRYIKNLLVREESISSVVMLLAPGRRYLQEGTVILDSLPRTGEEWAKFDVIILGDLWPGVFTREQLELLKQRVSIAGAGLIFIGGEGSTPGAWRTTPLADLLPFALSESLAGGTAGLERFDGPVTLAPTPGADRLGVLRLSDQPDEKSQLYWPPELSDPSAGWSQLYFVQRIDPATLKPAAETLAIARPVSGNQPASPAVLSMRYGAGRVLYVATDEIWRWRYGRGERLPERFWIQMVRLLGRESVSRSGRPAIIEVLPERAEVDQPVRVQLTLTDQALIESAPPTIKVRIAPGGGGREGDGPQVTELTLTAEATRSGDAAASRVGGTRVYATTWVPTQPGRFVASSTDPALSGSAAPTGDVSTRVEVWQPDDELRRPQTDHALLAALSQATGGQALTASQLSQLPRLLPSRSVKLAGDPEVHTLWDTPLALLLVLLLLTLEWVGRRLLHLA